MRNIDAIVIHQSLTEDGDELNYGGIVDSHIERGFDREGYHYIIEKVRDRVVAIAGRPLHNFGAHCTQNKMNHRSIGICVCGCFDHHAPSKEVYEVLISLCVDLCISFNIPANCVYPHSFFATKKTCPGYLFNITYVKNETARRIVKEIEHGS